MKKILGIIAVIAIVVITISLTNKKPANAPLVQETPADQVSADAPSVTQQELEDIADGSYVVMDNSQINWTGKAIGKSHSGTLALENGIINIQEGNINGELAFNMNSITSPSGDGLVSHLKNADFFDVEMYPSAALTVGNYENGILDGELTIKGITNEVSFPVILIQEGENIKLVGDISFDRTQWGIQYGSGRFFDDLGDSAIDDMIDLAVDLTLKPQDAQ